MRQAALILMIHLISLAAWAGKAAPPPEIADDLRPVRMAVADLAKTFPDDYANGKEFLARADKIALMPKGKERNRALNQLRQEALLSNPLLDFGRMLLARRKADGHDGMPANWQGNEKIPRTGYTDSIEVLSLDDLKGELRTLFKPNGGQFVGDLDLHFDGDRLLFSMPGANGRWQVHEMALDSAIRKSSLRELSLIPDDDVDNYDACYLPNGNILFTSTATFTGVPCVTGNSYVANLYLLDGKTKKIRRLTFDQEHNWNPTVLNNGRVMYLRWEYSDLPHFVARILFQMNPDGTNQAEFYGSGSYWPNSFFNARAVPDHPTRVVGVVTGHHGARRAGELVILDPAQGRFEADGAVQRIPGYGKKVEPIILDKLVDASWPKFLHPYPLSSKYFIVSMKRNEKSNWAIYLVDTFDNMILLKKDKDFHLLEPTPLLKRPAPPVVPDRVDLKKKFAVVYMEDIYAGPGLKGVPRGTVEKMRLFTYHYSYRGMGGQNDPIGVDGPWDIKCVLGTVPVEPDGSALFRVPANVPLSFQPLDKEGKAIQLMRSWSTAMPGENVSCVGCHEPQNAGPTAKTTIAARKAPSDITLWRDRVVGFSFAREVQPVVDKHCARCHQPAEGKASDHPKAPQTEDAYMFLARVVRSPTMEPDMHVLEPYEFHADTTELVRMLQTGHHGVRLDADSWDRVITWIDLNRPFHGTWTENVGHKRMKNVAERRRDLMRRYAGINGVDEEPQQLVEEKPPELQSKEMRVVAAVVEKKREPVSIESVSPKSFKPETRVLDLGQGARVELARIPAGAMQKGAKRVKIEEPFWMARFETSNALYARFDARHDSRLEPADFLHFDTVKRGYPLNAPDQPAVKVTWTKAKEFCQWLSEETGLDVSLPTEEEWEWACRAGSTDSFWYGESPFSQYENLADVNLKGGPWDRPQNGNRWHWRPAVADQDDGHRVSSPVGSFKANPWGLFDMHGNVAEWTASRYPSDQNAPQRVVRGGSWADRPKWADAETRWGYREFQKVYNVGFRVVVKGEGVEKRLAATPSP